MGSEVLLKWIPEPKVLSIRVVQIIVVDLEHLIADVKYLLCAAVVLVG